MGRVAYDRERVWGAQVIDAITMLPGNSQLVFTLPLTVLYKRDSC